jgi:RNA polymerase primary sigma factor
MEKVTIKTEDNAFGIYLKELRGFKPLELEEERALFAIIEKNRGLANNAYKKARDKIVFSHLRYVVYIAKAFVNRGLLLEDLVQEGNGALCRAADHFRPREGKRFISYAALYIRGALKQAIYDQGALIRIPQCRQKKISAKKIAPPVIEISEVFPSHYRNPEEEFFYNEAKKAVALSFNALDEREKSIIAARSINPEQKRATIQSLAEKFSISHQRVAQIEKAAKEKMASCLRAAA